MPDSIVAAVILPPNEVEVPAIVIAEFAKLALGIADNPNVNVSVPAFAEMFKPCPEEDAKFKDPVNVFAKIAVPLNEAVENELGTTTVPAVK